MTIYFMLFITDLPMINTYDIIHWGGVYETHIVICTAK